MRLVTRHAVDLGANLGDVARISYIRDRMALGRMTSSVFQWQDHHFILGKVVFRQFHASVEDRNQMFGFELLRLRLWPVALKAQRICLLGAQQMVIVPTVRLMTGCASLPKSWLMEMGFLELIGLIGMAGETRADRIRLQETRASSGVRVMASYALPLCTGMLHFGLFDLLRLIAVTGYAERPRVCVRQNHFAVFGGGVADFAALVGKRRVREFLQQLRLRGLVRIVALRAIRGCEGLTLVDFDQGGILNVVAVDTERRDRLAEVIVELLFPFFTCSVGHVTGVASHIQCGMTAAFFGHIQALGVAIQAQVLALVARCSFEQLILVLGNVGVVTLYAVPYGGRMNDTFGLGGILFRVATEAEGLGCRRDKFYVSNIAIGSDLVTT
jgi:hypothetical protein